MSSTVVVNAAEAVKDLSVTGIEITQGIQCFDRTHGYTNCPDNSLELDSDKPTMVRVYLGHDGTCSSSEPLSPILKNVRVKLTWGATHQPNIPFLPSSHKEETFDVPCSTNLTQLRDSTKGSANFIIPPAELGSPNKKKVLYVGAEVISPSNFQDSNVTNNNKEAQVELVPHHLIRIAAIQIEYKPKPNSLVAPPTKQSPNARLIYYASDHMAQAYPVPINFVFPNYWLRYEGTDIRLDEQGFQNQLLIQLANFREKLNQGPYADKKIDALIGWLPSGANANSGVRGLSTNAGNVAWCVQSFPATMDDGKLERWSTWSEEDWKSFQASDWANQICMAHEITHAVNELGIVHADEEGCSTQIQEAGFNINWHPNPETEIFKHPEDTTKDRKRQPRVIPSSTRDWMTTNAHDGWISPRVWNQILKKPSLNCPSS